MEIILFIFAVAAWLDMRIEHKRNCREWDRRIKETAAMLEKIRQEIEHEPPGRSFTPSGLHISF